MTVWLATRVDSVNNETTVVGIFATEVAARAAVKAEIEGILSRNSRTQAWWADSNNAWPTSASVTWDIGGTDWYWWAEMPVQE